MARPKKPKNDSAEGQRLLLQAAGKEVAPAYDLSESSMTYFNHYTSTRPSFEWNRAELLRLTRISDRMAEIDVISEQIKIEGPVVVNQRGTQIANPLITARDQMERTVMAAERSLSVYSPLSGDKKTVIAEQSKKIEQIKSNSTEDDLI